MTKQKLLVLTALLGTTLLPLSATANHYQQTADYSELLDWADALKGISFTDPSYAPYCHTYALSSVKQVQQRTNQRCTSAIPANTPNLQGRWNTNRWAHKAWCLGHSAHASKAELIQRENGLKNCLSNHAPTPAQIVKDCLKGGNFHKKAARGDLAYVTKCLNAGVDVNSREQNNWTPLHSAARNGSLSVAKLLINWGAIINARDNTNRTPLDQAIAGQNRSMENYLLSKGGVTR